MSKVTNKLLPCFFLLSACQVVKEQFEINSNQKTPAGCFDLNLVNKGSGGVKRDRTADLLRARQALSQLSYNPNIVLNVSF